MPNPAVRALMFDVVRKGDHATVHCYGSLIYGVGHLLYEQVQALIPVSKHITLDLTELAYVDSTGLGTLVRLYVSAKGAGCRVELVNLGKQVRELLGMTNLLGVFGSIGEQGIVVES